MEGKVAVVTGAASGIGRAAALAFAERGARVVVADLNISSGEETAETIRAAGGAARFVRTDVTKAQDVEAMVDAALATFGGIDYAFNNAGIFPGHASLFDYSEETWDKTIAINLKGVWLCMKYQAPHMARRGGGAIVNTSSTVGLIGAPKHYGYAASKWGVCGITKGAARELASQAVRVNAICPGVIETPMVQDQISERSEQWLALHPLGRFGQPQDISSAVMWLCSDDASFITGQLIAVDGGWSA